MQTLGRFLSVLVCLIFLTACTKKSVDEAISIIFNDGRATLEVSQLPVGLTADDISITTMKTEVLPLAGDKTGWKGYDFSPDGTEFTEPVYVSLPYTEGMPIYFHVHDGVISPIENIEYILSEDGNVARFALDRFSYVLESNNGAEVYTVDFSAEDTYVGEKMPIKAKITLLQDVEDEGADAVLYIHEAGRTVNGSLWVEGPLTPSAKTGRPSNTMFQESYTMVSDQDFRCAQPGEVTIEYHFDLHYTVDYYYKFLGIERDAGGVTKRRPRGTYVKLSTTANCLEALPPEPKCGDGKVNRSVEECDGVDLQNASCSDFGYNAGTLTCSSTCLYEYELCKKVAPRREISCSDNSREKYSEYDANAHTCGQDCDKGMYCDTVTCICKPIEKGEPLIDEEARLQEELQAVGKILEEGFSESSENDCDLPGVDCDDEEKQEEVKEKKLIEAIRYKEHVIPRDQIHFGTGPECEGKEHWHANTDIVITLTGKEVKDPAGAGCGFGLTADVPVIRVEDTRE